MKTLTSVVVTIVLLSTLVVKGASFAGFGSVENAINNYAVPGVKTVGVSVYQKTSSGFVDVKDPENVIQSYTSMDQVNTVFRQLVKSVAAGALTNSLVDKNAEFGIFASGMRRHSALGRVTYLGHSSSFHLTKSVDGSYSLPDFSNLELELVGSMVYHIPGLEWARIEVSYNPTTTGMTGTFHVVDSTYDPPDGSYTEVSPELDYLQVSTAYATAGTNNTTLIKISTIVKEDTNYVFRVFGPMGDQIPETPIRLTGFKIRDGEVSFSIQGGDCGRRIAVQVSSTPNGPWLDCEQFTLPPYTLPLQFRQARGPTFGFYRVRTVESY